MKTRQILLISRSSLLMLFLLSFLTFSSPGQTDFFYSFDGDKIKLDIIPGRVVVKPVESLSREQITQSLHASFGPVSARSITGLLSDGFIEIEIERLEKDKVQTLETINTMRHDPELFVVNPVYEIDGNPLIAYDVFVIYIEDETVMSELERLNQQYNVELIDRDIFLPNIISLRMLSYDEKSVTEMARLYYENLSLSWSVPDFKREIIRHSQINDPYYPYQFYLNMTSTPLAWDITKGVQDIVVAVIDDGVMVHEDLPSSRMVEGYDAFDKTDGAPGGNEAHGMAVAGIIAASHNDKGIAGTAPNVKIMPVRIFDEYGDETTDLLLLTAFSYAVNNGADVINNSWTYNTSSDANPQLTTIIQNAMQDGRDGKGTVIVFSSGNIGSDVRYPANIPGVIAVGAVNENDEVFSWSARGPELDLVAPSGEISTPSHYAQCGEGWREVWNLNGNIWSLDHNGPSGTNPGTYNTDPPECYNEYVWTPHGGQPNPGERYTAHFGGTSAASPQVSGVVALLLSVDSDLYLHEIRDILHNSADTLPGMGGQNFTEEYGYGRLNAYNALLSIVGSPPSPPVITLDASGMNPKLYWNTVNGADSYNIYRGTMHAAPGTGSCIQIPDLDYYHIGTTTSTTYTDHSVWIDPNISILACYYATSVNQIGESAPSNKVGVHGMAPLKEDELITAETISLPEEFAIFDNYPNPFNPVTTIRYNIPEPSTVSLIIYDITGREVRRLVDGTVEPGYHTAVWNGTGISGRTVSSGVYIYRFTAVPANDTSHEGITTVRKMVFTK